MVVITDYLLTYSDAMRTISGSYIEKRDRELKRD